MCIHQKQIDIFINTSWRKVFKLLISYHEMWNFSVRTMIFLLVSFWVGWEKVTLFSFALLGNHLKKIRLKWTASEQTLPGKGVNKFIFHSYCRQRQAKMLFMRQRFYVSLVFMTYQLRWAASLLEQTLCDTSFLWSTRTMAFKIKSCAWGEKKKRCKHEICHGKKCTVVKDDYNEMTLSEKNNNNI